MNRVYLISILLLGVFVPKMAFGTCSSLQIQGDWDNNHGQFFKIQADSDCRNLTFSRIPQKTDSKDRVELGPIRVSLQPEGSAKFEPSKMSLVSGKQGLPQDALRRLNVFFETGRIKVERVPFAGAPGHDYLRITTTNHIVLPREFTRSRTQTGVFKAIANLTPSNFAWDSKLNRQVVTGLQLSVESLELIGIVNGDGTEIETAPAILYGANLVLQIFKSTFVAKLRRITPLF